MAEGCTHTRAYTRAHACPQGPAPGLFELALQSETRQGSRSPALSWHHPGDRQTDRQTGCSAWEPDGQTDSQPTTRRGSRAGRQPPPGPAPTSPGAAGCASAARRLHLVENPRPGVRSRSRPSVRGPRGSAWPGGPPRAGDAGTEPAPGSFVCFSVLSNTLRPCTVTPRTKCGGIYFNRWRTIFF